jgi:hypothetical protein
MTAKHPSDPVREAFRVAYPRLAAELTLGENNPDFHGLEDLTARHGFAQFADGWQAAMAALASQPAAEPRDAILARMVVLAPYTSFLGAYENEWRELIARAAEQPSTKSEPPCGECHLRAGETCDICGAERPIE